MEPLSALGVAGNVIQFIDFSSKLIRGATEVYGSVSGLPDNLRDIAAITKSLDSFITKLPSGSPPPAASANEKAFAQLAESCRQTCIQLQQLVQEIKGSGNQSGSRVKSFGVALRGLIRKGELEELEKRLDRYRSQIVSHFLWILRSVQDSSHTFPKPKY